MIEQFKNLYSMFFEKNEVLFMLCCIPLTILTGYFVIKLTSSILDIQTTKKKTILFTIFNGLLIIFGRIIMPAPYYRIYNLFAIPISMYIVYKENICKLLLSDVIVFLITVAIDTIFSYIYCIIYNIESFVKGFEIPIFKLSLVSTIMLTTMICYLIVKKLKIKVEINEDEISKNDKVRIIIASSVGLFIMSVQLLEVVFLGSRIPIFYILSNIVAMMLYFFLSMSNIIKISSIKTANEKIETLEIYNQTLKKLYDNTRAFKHDFNNIIQTIGGYAMMGDIEGLRKYHSDIIKDCKDVNNLEILNPNIFNNPAIYSIVNNKVYKARKLGIEMNVSISLDLNKINMKIYEMTRVLGILLDNAIEASKECENKVINIEFLMNKLANIQIVKIYNTYKEKEVDINKIFEKDYSTKKGNTGLGLWEVRKIIKRNSNLNLFTSKDNEYFKQELEIYV